MNLINGRQATESEARAYLDNIGQILSETQSGGYPDTETVICSSEKLSRSLCHEDTAKWRHDLQISENAAAGMLAQAKHFLSRAYLEHKLALELGPEAFSFHDIGHGRSAAFRPLGVLTHIAAGNAAGLPAFSVLEGLLAGNINLLKLPGTDDGLSTMLLGRLTDIEPRLSPYISVFDLPSADTAAIKKLLAVSDAAAVWGSDFAISGIRALAPPGLQLIEWGHRISFCCVTKAGETPEALDGIAKDICETEQLVCSAPQCVYYESDTFADLVDFGERLSSALKTASNIYPPRKPDAGTQAEITELLTVTSLEELLEDKKVIRGDGYAVIADDDAALAASPGFRTIWLRPLRRGEFDSALRQKSGYLQTAGVACTPEELSGLSERLYRCGVCRVLPCGEMTSNTAGEPHDGQYALRRYVKAVVRMQ